MGGMGSGEWGVDEDIWCFCCLDESGGWVLLLGRVERWCISALIVQSGEDRIAGQPSRAAVDGGAGVRHGCSTNLKIVLRPWMGAFVVQSGTYRIAGRRGMDQRSGQPSDVAVYGGAGVRYGWKHFSNTFLLYLDEVERRSPVRSWLVR